MNEPWFYLNELPQPGAVASLDAREARHATGARRLGIGDGVCLFDGLGHVARATIRSMNGRDVSLSIKDVARHNPPLPHVHLAAALPKGDRQSVLLSMGTQLGMNVFTPLQCERAVAKPGRSFTERTQRIFIESCKQSRQALLPSLNELAAVHDVVRSCSSESRVYLAHPGGQPIGEHLNSMQLASEVLLLVGPEGGFTEQEVAAAQNAGAAVVSLGERVLRMETAAVAMLAMVRLVSTK